MIALTLLNIPVNDYQVSRNAGHSIENVYFYFSEYSRAVNRMRRLHLTTDDDDDVRFVKSYICFRVFPRESPADFL